MLENWRWGMSAMTEKFSAMLEKAEVTCIGGYSLDWSCKNGGVKN